MNAPRKKEKNWLEWCVFAAGLLLVLALVAYLTYDIATARSGPPNVQVELGRSFPQSAGYAVPVTVTNRGHETAEQVHIEVQLTRPDGQTEKGELMLQFLPRGATRHGTVTFTVDPRRAGSLTSRVLGYERP